MPPLVIRRLGWGAILLAAACGAAATAWRDELPITAAHRGATHVLDTLGLAFAVTGAVMGARVNGLLFDSAPRRVRRRAWLLTVLGLLVSLVGCVVLGTAGAAHGDRVVRVTAAGGLAGGLGAGLAGCLSLAWTVGLGYAADRLDRRDRD